MSGERVVDVLHVGSEPDGTALSYIQTCSDSGRFHIVNAEDVADGLDELADASFDCVVSAYELPGRDGIELLRAVRENYGDLPFVLFATEGDEMVASEAVSAGVTEYVPERACDGHPGELLDRIESAVGTEAASQNRRSDARFGGTEGERFTLVLEPNGTVRSADQTARDYFDTTREALVDTRFWETSWWGGGARSDVKSWVERAAAGERVSWDATEAGADASERPAGGEIRPVTGENGAVSALAVVGHGSADPSQRTRTRTTTETQLSLALEAAGAAVWEMDLETRELRWDERAQRLWGYEPGEFTGTFEEFKGPVRPDDWDRLETAYRTAIETQSGYEVEVRVEPDGTPMRWVQAAGQVVTDQNGESRRLVGLSLDITERKERERDLQQQNERLEEFASVISHDLRNPLTTAQGRATHLAERMEGEHLGALRRALDRMEAIVEDTLTLARQGEILSEPTLVSLTDLVEGCWATVETDSATVEVVDEVTFQGDPDRLRHVFENLFRNAVEHGGSDVSVRVGRHGEQGIYVEDDGPGIPVDSREAVFEAGHSSTRDSTGFGLTIVRRIVKAHGWELSVTDGTVGGARFELTGVTVAA